MLQSVRGRFQNGIARPAEPVEGREGQEVIITFVEERPNPPLPPPEESPAEQDPWEQLIERCAVDTGIPDLAHQHDHYIHGTPRKA